MDIKVIYNYLNELARCEWKDNATVNGIIYNGINIVHGGTETYQRILNDMQNKAEQSLLELYATSQQQIINAIYRKAKELYEKDYDIINQSTVDALKQEFAGQRTKEQASAIELGQYVVNMHALQKCHLLDLLSFIHNLLADTSYVEVEVLEKTPNKTDEQIIKGVKGLANHLGCGITKAQAILNSGILQKNGIAYRNGKAWRLNPQKLDKLLSDSPNIFRKI